jgi:hypothetical protein
VAGIAHRSFSGPPKTFSPSFSTICLWIRGLFLAIEFAMAPSSPLPNSGDPGATVVRTCLNSGDLTAAERTSAARSRLFPRSDPLHLIQIERPGPRIPLRARTPNTLARLSVPFTAIQPPRSDFPRPILIERFRPLWTPSDPSLRPILIERLGPPRTLVAIGFPPGAGPTWSARSAPLSLTLPAPLVSARLPVSAPSTADLISAVGF